jgi:hypothetical protein
MQDDNKQIQNNIDSEENLQEKYGFTDNMKKEDTGALTENPFDIAFNKASPTVRDYILSDKFEDNVKLICKIEKLEDDKSNTIIENIAVSILIGVLPINEAKETMIESFKASGVILETFTAGLILKNIDAYILKDIRKQILESKVEEKKEIRHLTLKESSEEREKEELRKILLERTGNFNGKGGPVFQYQQREIKVGDNTKLEARESSTDNTEVNRDSLLAKINLQNVSDIDKIKERMQQIRKEEEERIEKLNQKQALEEEIRSKRESSRNIQEISLNESEEKTINPDVSKEFAEMLKNKLESHEDENTDLDKLRKERGEAETKLKEINDISAEGDEIYNPKISSLDPYRENF